MSWISGIADKAEQILVKIDESAAGKLQKKKNFKPTQEVILTGVTSETKSGVLQLLQGPSLTQPQSPIKRSTNIQIQSDFGSVNVNKDKDEDLIDFLNDNTNKYSAEYSLDKSTAGMVESHEHYNGDQTKSIDCGNQNEDENQVLKNEIRVLNNELSLLLHRTQGAEKVTENFKSKIQSMEETRLILEDENNELKTKLRNLEHLNTALATEKDQLKEYSYETQQEKQQILQLQKKVQTLQENQHTEMLRLQRKERECAMVEESRLLHQQEVDSLTQRLQSLQSDLHQYRMRAQRTLSDKEAIINQLRTNNSSVAVQSSLHTELNQLREEREVLREEVAEAVSQLDTAHRRLLEVEHTLEQVRESAARTHHELRSQLAHETHKRGIIEEDYRLQTQELRQLREEMSSQLSQLNCSLREREAELSHLKNQLAGRPSSPSSHLMPGELELRLSSLTKTLIQKQTALESATIERNQLRMQYEGLEHKLREQMLMHQQSRVVSANDTDDAKAQVPSFLVENPLDTGVARRVKRAYSSLDAVSIRTGVFLRRYPLARIFVLLYVVVLHSLVLMVLFSRTPDNTQK